MKQPSTIADARLTSIRPFNIISPTLASAIVANMVAAEPVSACSIQFVAATSAEESSTGPIYGYSIRRPADSTSDDTALEIADLPVCACEMHMSLSGGSVSIPDIFGQREVGFVAQLRCAEPLGVTSAGIATSAGASAFLERIRAGGGRDVLRLPDEMT